MSENIGQTPTRINDQEGQPVYPGNAYVDGGEHVNEMPWDHAYLHYGSRFFVSNRVSVANTATADIVVEVGASLNPHMKTKVAAGGDFHIDIYENTDADADGTLYVSQNHNREVQLIDSVSPTVSLRLDPTVNAAGDVFDRLCLFGGTGPLAVGTSGEGRDEFILTRSVKYLYRFTNVSGQTQDLCFEFDWYEHEPVGKNVV